MDIELQRNNSIQKRPVGQSMKKFERNTGRILLNAEPVSIISRSSSDALGGQGRMLHVERWICDIRKCQTNIYWLGLANRNNNRIFIELFNWIILLVGL